MKYKRKLAIVCAIAVVLLIGCDFSPKRFETSGESSQQAPLNLDLKPQRQPPIPDFPVPVGFRLDEKNSRDYALAAARLVDHAYKGKEDKLSVKKFYERQMPINRWTLTTAMFVQGDVMLDFEKENERCRVSITGGNYNTEIKVRLWTSAPLQVPTHE